MSKETEAVPATLSLDLLTPGSATFACRQLVAVPDSGTEDLWSCKIHLIAEVTSEADLVDIDAAYLPGVVAQYRRSKIPDNVEKYETIRKAGDLIRVQVYGVSLAACVDKVRASTSGAESTVHVHLEADGLSLDQIAALQAEHRIDRKIEVTWTPGQLDLFGDA